MSMRKSVSVFVRLSLLVITSYGVGQAAWLSTSPAPRSGHSAVIQPEGNLMVVFGGATPAENDPSLPRWNDVWRLNNNLTWTKLAPVGAPPLERFLHSAVYDAVNDRMTVFGGARGSTSPCLNDLWVLSDATGINGTPAWTQLAPAGTAPSPRAQHGAVYDLNTNSMIVYGGQDCFSTSFAEVWVLSFANGMGGTPTWTQLSPVGTGPGAREVTGCVTYDPANNRLILFGGSNLNNDVWILTHANGQGGTPTWTQLAPTGTLPPSRGSTASTYDAKSNRLTIFSGDTGALQPAADAWVLTHANGLGGAPVWTQLTPPSPHPNGRFYHSAVYNPKKNRMTIYGGVDLYGGGSVVIANDVWVLDNANGK